MEIKDISRDMFVNFLSDMLKFSLSGIVVYTSSNIGSEVLTQTFETLQGYTNLIFVLLMGLGGMIFIYLYDFFRIGKPRFPNIKFDFRVIAKEIKFEFDENGKIVYKKIVKVQALKNDLSFYCDKYQWTGGLEIDVISAIKEHQFHKTFRRNRFQMYQISFNRSLKKRDIVETELVWNLDDNAAEMIPFLSATVSEPTKNLIFSISFPKDQNVSQIIGETSSSVGSTTIFKTDELTVDRYNTVRWEVKKPKLLYHYEIRWVV